MVRLFFILISFYFLSASNFLQANHLTGGEISYAHEESFVDGRELYKVTLIIYRDALSGGADFDSPLYLSIYDMDRPRFPRNISLYLDRKTVEIVPLNDLGPCARNVPNIKIEKGTYVYYDTVSLNNNGYVYVHQRCCRSDVISNLYMPGDQGSTYSVHLTREAILQNNSNPIYNKEAPILICAQSNFEYQFNATDNDGHRLRYYLCEPHLGGTSRSPKPSRAPAPPYDVVQYLNGYSYAQPFGANVDVRLGENSGILTLKADRIGKFTVAVCIEEFDANDKSLGFVKRDLMFNVADCQVTSAGLSIEGNEVEDGVYATCNGQTVQFNNQSSGANSFYWNFGVGVNDTSTLMNPSFAYTAPGEYDVTLIINRGEACTDTSIIKVRVFPYLEADFDYSINCVDQSVLFTSQSISTHDPIVSETWWVNQEERFVGENFQFYYENSGEYEVELVARTQRGCLDIRVENIDLPQFTQADFSINGINSLASETLIICDDDQVDLIANIPDDIPRQWTVEGVVINDIAVSHIFSDTGKHQIDLTVNPGTVCEDTQTKWVRILPNPEADFSFQMSCLKNPVDFKVLGDRSFDPIDEVLWDFGDNTTSVAFNLSKKYDQVDEYKVKLSVVTKAGCIDAVVKNLKVPLDPIADFEIKGNDHNGNYLYCEGLAIDFESTSQESNSITWNFGLGQGASTQENESFIFNGVGTHDIRLIADNGQGCTDTLTKSIDLIHEITLVDFGMENICAHAEQTFSNLSVAVKDNFVSYYWDFGDGTTSNQEQPDKVYNAEGTYDVKLIVETATGCRDSIIKPITIFSVPTASFEVTDLCLHQTKAFESSSTINSGSIASYLWTTPEETSTDENPHFSFTASGDVTVLLQVESDQGCIDTTSRTFHVQEAALVDFEYLQTCVDEVVEFKDLSSSENDIVQWNWTFEENEITNGAETNHFYSTMGSHEVQLEVVTTLRCRDSLTKTIDLVNEITLVDFELEDICAQAEQTFTNLSVALKNNFVSYFWDFGDGTTSNQEQPDKVYNAEGTYDVKLIVETATGCRDSIIKPITIFSVPTASFETIDACLNQAKVFESSSTINSGSITSYLWTALDETSTDEKPEFIFTSSGEVMVQLQVVSDQGCSDSTSRNLQVQKASLVDFEYKQLCVDQAVEFKDLSSSEEDDISQWNWTFENGSTSNGAAVSHLFSADGSHDVQLEVVTTLGCRDSLTKTILIDPHPNADFVFDGLSLGGNSFVKCDDSYLVQFANESVNNLSNLWMINNAEVTDEESLTYTFEDTGIYIINLTINPGTNCSDNKEVSLNILPGLYAEFDFINACVGQDIQLVDQSKYGGNDIINSEWLIHGEESLVGSSVFYQSDSTGDVDVLLKVSTSSGCIDSIAKTIAVHELPDMEVNYEDFCPTQQSQLFLTSNGVGINAIESVFWDFGDGKTSTESTPAIQFDEPGAYEFDLKVVSKAGCADSLHDILLVRDFIIPTINYIENIFCEDTPLHFTASASEGIFQEYLWEIDSRYVSDQEQDSYVFTERGAYNIRLTLKDSLCGEFSTEQQVEVLHSPDLYLGEDFALCPNLTAEIEVESDLPIDSLFWSTGEQNTSNITVFGNIGRVSVKAYNNGCFSEAFINIIPSCEVYAPKAFSPNGDGVHDYFNLIPHNVESFVLVVFDRWGNEVFRTNSLSNSWDGTYKGDQQPMDNYSYYSVGKKTDGSDFTIKGSVLLIR